MISLLLVLSFLVREKVCGANTLSSPVLFYASIAFSCSFDFLGVVESLCGLLTKFLLVLVFSSTSLS